MEKNDIGRETPQELKIETIEAENGGEVSFCPERGAIITSLKLGGKEVLYMDEETLKDTSKNVKGGIPILFPNAGPVDSPDFPGLKQHGYARVSSEWEFTHGESGKFSGTLLPNQETLAVYPFNVALNISGKFEDDNSFTLIQEVENREETKEAPVAMGLHPYFKVQDSEKKNIKFDFEGGSVAEQDVEKWASGGTVSIDNPRVKDPNAKIKVLIPGLGTLVIDASPEYKKIWVWSMPNKDFVCVEPVMRDSGGLIDDPELVKPSETLQASVNFRLE